MMNIIKLVLVRNYSTIILIFLLFLGSFLRFNTYLQNFSFYADAARDTLVAKHMIFYDGFAHVAPGASSGWHLINNSPVYFWVLAICWFFLRSPTLMPLPFVFAGIWSIYISYKIGEALENKNLGLTFAFFVAVSNSLVRFSFSVYQPYLIPLLTVLSCYFLLLTFKTNNLIWLFMASLCVFLGLHMHYSFLPVFIIFSLWIFFSIIKSFKKTNAVLLLLFVIFLCVQALLWIYLTSIKTPFDQFSFFSELLTRSQQNHMLKTLLIIRGMALVDYIFSTNYRLSLVPLMLGTVVWGSVPLIIISDIRHKKYYGIFFASLAASVIITSLYVNHDLPNSLYPHYFSPYLIIFPLCLALVIHQYIPSKPCRLIVILAIGYFLTKGNTMNYHNRFNNIAVFQKIAQVIVDDAKTYSLQNTEYWVLDHNPKDPQFNYYIGQYYYFLEDITGKQLVKLTSEEQNITPINPDPKAYYLVCSWFSVKTTQNELNNKCLMPFIHDSAYRTKKLTSHYVGAIVSNTNAFYMFRFDLRQHF